MASKFRILIHKRNNWTNKEEKLQSDSNGKEITQLCNAWSINSLVRCAEVATEDTNNETV